MNDVDGLRSALQSWGERPFIGRDDATPKRTYVAANKVMRELGALEARQPNSYELADLHKRACAALAAGGVLRLAISDLRRLPWVLFYPKANNTEERRQWLGSQRAVASDYGRWMRERTRTGAVLALVHEFLRVYPVELPVFDSWLRTLASLVTGARSPRLQRMASDLFVMNGDRKVVGRMVADRNADMEEIGLSPGLARCAFLRSGVMKQLAAVGLHVELDGLLNVLEFQNELRFTDSEMCMTTADALLLPFALRQSVGAETMDRVCAWFVHHFGDPRFHASEQKWRGASQEARMVVVKWLVRNTLEQFFELLERTAYDRHWRYRRTFWNAYLQRGMVDEAWFVLGPLARMMMRPQSNEASAFGSASLSGATSDQSVLLMRIGNATIAEWSHNGSCRIWDPDNERAPRLYDQEYSRDELASRSADFIQPHYSSTTGGWQGQVAYQIERYTGVKVPRTHYLR